MGDLTKKLTKEIAVVGEDGAPHTVLEYTYMRKFQSTNGHATMVPGAKEYFLSTGEDLNKISDLEFEAVLSEMRYSVV